MDNVRSLADQRFKVITRSVQPTIEISPAAAPPNSIVLSR